MEDNAIESGRPRIGFLADGDASTPLLPAQLVRTGDGIEVRIPWLHGQFPDRWLERWFAGNAHWGGDPDKSLFRYSPPPELEFYDAYGPVALIGCWSRGYRRSFGLAGEGRVGVTYAIPGARDAGKYATINGLRSQIDGLGSWYRRTVVVTEPVLDEYSRIRAVDLHAEAPPETPVSRRLNLKLRPDFRFGHGESPDDTVVTERMLVETLARRPRAWAEHLDSHVAIRDLLRLSSWRRLDFLAHEVTRDDDPVRTMDGASHGRQWHHAETALTGIEDRAGRSEVSFLFAWDDIGPAGVRTWSRIRADMGRAVDPLLGLLGLRGATVEAHWSQLGIGLEALGYLLAREAGTSKSKADAMTFEQRLSHVVEQTEPLQGVGLEGWVGTARRHYRAVKHADRLLPDPQDLARSYHGGVLLFRVWLANRLGAPASRLEDTVQSDPVARRLQT